VSPVALLALGYLLFRKKQPSSAGVGADFRKGSHAAPSSRPGGRTFPSTSQRPGSPAPGTSTRTSVDPNDPNMVWVQDASGGHWERKSADPATAAAQQGLVDPTTVDPNWAQQYYGGTAYPGNMYGQSPYGYGPPGGYGGYYGGIPAGYGGFGGYSSDPYGSYGYSDPFQQSDPYADWLQQYSDAWGS
jgi:hypothetical protein